MITDDFKVALSAFNVEIEGEVSAKSPSNIALVKYWGKTNPQIPTNPSISYTLTESYTDTRLEFNPKKADKSQIQVLLADKDTPSFVPKIQQFFDRIGVYAPYLQEFDFIIKTVNSFPHSSGIASSASGMSALAKCLMLMEKQMGFDAKNIEQRASFLSRLGSGSACRSIYPGLVAWGNSEFISESSDLYAVPLQNEIHPVFKTFHDTILLIHEGTKTVSSTVGHNLMNNHPYAATRFSEAKKNMGQLLNILQSGNLEQFGELVEHEAMTLHAVMMMSNPPYILMMPNTVAAIHKIWNYRKETQNPLYFTLDAGANIHLLYPDSHKVAIQQFIQNELIQFCQNGKAIYDQVNFDRV